MRCGDSGPRLVLSATHGTLAMIPEPGGTKDQRT
jgi:hypothetical protein